MREVYIKGSRLSYEMDSFSNTDYVFTMDTPDEILVGSYKPINHVFFAVDTANISTANMFVYFFNGITYQTLDIVDETRNLSRPGIVRWARNQSEYKTTEFGKQLYWYKVKFDGLTNSILLNGIGVLFSADYDLIEEYPNIADMMPNSWTSFLKFHIAAKKEIMGFIRNRGIMVNTKGGQRIATEDDILEPEELRDASKFMTLSKIFRWASDSVGDKWDSKAAFYEQKYGDQMSMINLSLDYNDDGKETIDEKDSVQSILLVRV